MEKVANKESQNTKWTKALFVILGALMVLSTYTAILRNNLITSERAFGFLKESQAFAVVADMTKAEIEGRLPDDLQSNFIRSAVASRVLDFIVTPESVAKLAEPGLRVAYRLAKLPTNVHNDKIVLDTVQYKEQAREFVPTLQLPTTIANTANRLVDATPDQLTIISLEKKSGSILAVFIKVRDTIRTINTTAVVLLILVIINILALIIINTKNIKRLLLPVAYLFGTVGLIVIVGSYAFTPIISVLLPLGADSSAESLNTLATNIIQHFFFLTRGHGWIFILLAISIFSIHWLVNRQDSQLPLINKLKNSGQSNEPKSRPKPKPKAKHKI